jgi:hypothetical protein
MAAVIGFPELGSFVNQEVWIMGKLKERNILTDGTHECELIWRSESAAPQGNPVVEIAGKVEAGNRIEVENVVVFEDSPEINFDIEGY